MSRAQELIESLDERLEEINEICALTLHASDLEMIRAALWNNTAEDQTKKYAGMIEAFECDFSLAKNPENGHGMDDLQVKIEQGDGRILSDIELLEELSYGIRHGTIKILKSEVEAAKIEK